MYSTVCNGEAPIFVLKRKIKTAPAFCPFHLSYFCQGYKFPRVRHILAWIRKPIIVLGLLGAILVYYFQYRNFFHIFSWRHTLACWTLSLGGGLAGGLTAYFLGLDSRQREHVHSAHTSTQIEKYVGL